MSTDAQKPAARDLLVTYLNQLIESGESELYVSVETARALRDGLRGRAGADSPPRGGGSGSRGESDEGPRRAPPSGEATSQAARKSAAVSGDVAGRGRTASASSAASKRKPQDPRPEVVPVELAIGHDTSTRDMFTAPSPLEGCASLDEVERLALGCTKCELARSRTNVVFGVGNPTATLMFVGEAPGRNEDLQGVPFVGRAGQLLDKILEAAGIERDDVYIGNIIKCRPPNNRTPLTSEIDACVPYLAKQIQFIKPRIVCTLGLPATQTLLGIRGSMSGLRGKIYAYRDIRIIPTYHPAAALRDPKYKRPLWEDFLLLKKECDRP